MARGRRAPPLRSRLHGLRHMCSRRAALPRRALWVLAFCTALGLLLSWSSNRLLHWLSFPSHTQVRSEWSRQLLFPAVTLCNNNPLRFPRLSKGDLYYAGHWLGLLLPNRTARPLLTELLRGDEARLRWFAKLADFRLFLPPRHYEGISADFMDRLGHQLEDMLLSCKYRGELCGPHNFSAVSPPRDPPGLPLAPPGLPLAALCPHARGAARSAPAPSVAPFRGAARREDVCGLGSDTGGTRLRNPCRDTGSLRSLPEQGNERQQRRRHSRCKPRSETLRLRGSSLPGKLPEYLFPLWSKAAAFCFKG